MMSTQSYLHKKHKFLNFPSKWANFYFVESFKDPHNKEYIIVEINVDTRYRQQIMFKIILKMT